MNDASSQHLPGVQKWVGLCVTDGLSNPNPIPNPNPNPAKSNRRCSSHILTTKCRFWDGVVHRILFRFDETTEIVEYKKVSTTVSLLKHLRDLKQKHMLKPWNMFHNRDIACNSNETMILWNKTETFGETWMKHNTEISETRRRFIRFQPDLDERCVQPTSTRGPKMSWIMCHGWSI